MMEPFDDKVRVLTRNNLSKSLGDLDQCAKSPETMLNDSYNKLYNAKIRKFMKRGTLGSMESILDKDVTTKQTDPGSPMVHLKNNMGLPRLGVDFGLMKPRTLITDIDDESQSDDAGEPTYEGNLNLPFLGIGNAKGGAQVTRLKDNARNLQFNTSDYQLSGRLSENPDVDALQHDIHGLETGLPSGKVKMPQKINLRSPGLDVDAPSGKLSMPNFGFSANSETDVKTPDMSLKTPKIKGGIHAPNVNLPKADLKDPSLGFGTPSVDTEVPSGKYKAPKFKMPYYDLPEIQVPGFDGDLNGPDFGLSGTKLKGLDGELRTPDIDLSAPKFKGALGSPDMNLPQMDLNKPRLDLSGSHVDVNMPSGNLKLPAMKKPNIGLNAPDMDIDAPSSKIKMPKLNLSGTLPKGPNLNVKSTDLNLKAPKIKGGIDAPDLDLPNMDLGAPKFDVNAPDVDFGSPNAKFKMPKLKFPGLKGPQIDGNFDGPDVDVNVPNVNLKGPNADLGMPDLDVSGPSGKLKKPHFKMPGFGISSPKFEGPNLGLKTPDLDLSGPNFGGGLNAPDINMPKVDLKSPKMDFNTPNLNLDMPSGKMKMPELHSPDWDVKAPSGKMKMPKFNLSGTLPKGPKMDINTGLSAPDLSLKAPKIKGGIDTPDLDLPNMDLKAPKFDVNAPDVNIGSPNAKFKKPKFKLPKFGLSGPKGPKIDGSLDVPDVDVNVPNVNLKGPNADLGMPDLDVSGPSGKLKKPHFKMPGFGLSSPKFEGPNLGLKTPDLDLSGPNFGGGLNAPDINMPKVDLKSPKMDFNSPKLNLDMPSGKMKMPELHSPDWDVKAPSGKMKLPKFNHSAPNINMNTDLKAPKVKGGIVPPDLDLPKFGLKAPKMPQLKMPEANLPSLTGPNIDGNFDGPDIDINAPNINLKGPKRDFEMPDVGLNSPSAKPKKKHLKIPDVGFSSPKFDGPNVDLRSPDLNKKLPKVPHLNMKSDLKTPKLKGGISSPKLGLPKKNLKTSQLDMDTPDFNTSVPDVSLQKPKIKMPKGPNVDINVPNVHFNSPKATFNIPSVNTPDLELSGPKEKLPDMNLSGPKLKGHGLKIPDLPKDRFSTQLDLNAKHPDQGIDGNLGRPDLNFTSPNVRGEIRGPSGHLQGPQTDYHLENSQSTFPNFSTPLEGPDFNQEGTGLEFGASRRPKNLDISSNAKLNMKPKELIGDFTGPNVSAPNMTKVAMRDAQLHLRSPDLNIDDPSRNFREPSYRNHRSDIPGGNMRMPDLNVDGDVGLRHMDMHPTRHNVTSSYPQADADFGHQIDFHRSDLNIDDFTGKDHVLRSRGSKLDFEAPHRLGEIMFPSHGNVHSRDPAQTNRMPSGGNDMYSMDHRLMQQVPNAHLSLDSRIRVPNESDQYYVTAFPNVHQDQRRPNIKHNTLPDMDLEVPAGNYQKGRSFLSNLM